MGLKNEGKKHLVKYVWGFAKPITLKKKKKRGGGGGAETIDESLSGPASLARGSKHRAAGAAVPGPAPSPCRAARAQPHLPGAQEASLYEAPALKGSLPEKERTLTYPLCCEHVNRVQLAIQPLGFLAKHEGS